MRRSSGSLAVALVVSLKFLSSPAVADEPGVPPAPPPPVAATETPPPASPPPPATPPPAESAITSVPAAAENPAPKKDERPAWQPIPTSDEQVLWAIALQGHGLFVPGFLLAPFLAQYTTLSSGGAAIQAIRRKGTLDIVLSLDFSFYTPADGNWMGAGKDPAFDLHYVQFHGLNFLSLDVGFLYTHDLASWIAIQIGGGVGLGYVFGEIDVINAADKSNNPGTTSDCKNFGSDPSKCFPYSAPNGGGDPPVTYVNGAGQTVGVGEIKQSDPDFQKKLDATAAAQRNCKPTGATNSCLDTAGHPYFHATTDKPPVLPVINFIIGFKFKLHRHFNFNVSGGFRNGFVVNGGPEYVF